MWMRLSTAGDDGAHVSISGSSARSAASAAAPSSAPPAYAPSTTTTERPDRNGGSSGSGGKWMIRNDVVTSSGAVRVHVVPGAQQLGVALVRPQHHAGVDLAVRVQAELHRGDDAEVAAAAAERPEQLGVVVRGRAHAARRPA